MDDLPVVGERVGEALDVQGVDPSHLLGVERLHLGVQVTRDLLAEGPDGLRHGELPSRRPFRPPVVGISLPGVAAA